MGLAIQELSALATLLDGESISEEDRAYYASLVADDYEPTSYDEAIGIDDFDAVNDRIPQKNKLDHT